MYPRLFRGTDSISSGAVLLPSDYTDQLYARLGVLQAAYTTRGELVSDRETQAGVHAMAAARIINTLSPMYSSDKDVKKHFGYIGIALALGEKQVPPDDPKYGGWVKSNLLASPHTRDYIRKMID